MIRIAAICPILIAIAAAQTVPENIVLEKDVVFNQGSRLSMDVARPKAAGHAAPAVLAISSLLFHAPVVLPFALIWINHIGVDRLLGYGLKYSDGFGFTHLGRIGKRA